MNVHYSTYRKIVSRKCFNLFNSFQMKEKNPKALV